MFPLAHLFYGEIRELPSVWVEPRKYLDTNGASLTQHTSQRIILTLSNSIYGGDGDRKADIQIDYSIDAEGRRPGIQPQADSSTSAGLPTDIS